MKQIAAVIIFSTLAAMGLAFAHPFGDPRVAATKGLDTLLQSANMPPDAKKVLVTKCADCHSNETRWPVYARVAPGSWLIERDIVEARKKMNLSIWQQMPSDKQDELIAKIIHEAKSEDMPPLQYRALHWQAKLTPPDIAALASMSKRPDAKESMSAPADPARGKLVFQKRCTGCHAMGEGQEGPNLAGVFGRKAGSVSGFDYSPGLKNSGITWDTATLERWLSSPDTLVPGTKMDFYVPKPQERSDLIAYFKQ